MMFDVPPDLHGALAMFCTADRGLGRLSRDDGSPANTWSVRGNRPGRIARVTCRKVPKHRLLSTRIFRAVAIERTRTDETREEKKEGADYLYYANAEALERARFLVLDKKTTSGCRCFRDFSRKS